MSVLSKTTKLKPTPLIVFAGNCQALQLAAMLKQSGVADSMYVGGDWGFLPSYRGQTASVLSGDVLTELKNAGRRIILVDQVGPLTKPRYASRIDPNLFDRRILFPIVTLWSMSRHRFVEAFKAHWSFARMHEVNAEANAAAQEKSNFPVDVASFVAREIPRRSLFHTVTHPSGAVYAELLKGLIELLKDEIDCAQLVPIVQACADEEGLNFQTDHPVAKNLMKTLGWDWGPDYETYVQMIKAAAEKRWDDLEENRGIYEALFARDTQFWRCFALLGFERQDDAIALPAFEGLLEHCPGEPSPWLQYARYLVRKRRTTEAEQLLSRARDFFGDSSAFHGVAARVEMMLRRLDEAEGHAREHWRRSSDAIHAAFPLIQVLQLQSRNDEAEDLILSLRQRSPDDCKRLEQFLVRIRA